MRRMFMLVIVAIGCGSKRSPKHDDAAVHPPSEASQCVKVFDRFHEALEPALTQLGLHETAAAARTRAPNVAGLAVCGRFDDVTRACLLGKSPFAELWKACNVESPFVFYDASSARDSIAGAAVSPSESAKRIDALTGTWIRTTATETVTWKIGKGGTLAVRHKTKQHVFDEPRHEIAFARDRSLAIKSGSSTQFVPFFGDGDRLFLSWTSGAFAIPFTKGKVCLDEADRDRWLVWLGGGECQLIDPTVGVSIVKCGWETRDNKEWFVYGDEAWLRRGDVLVHPAMEVFAKGS